jgi:hypothetical protein
MTDKIVKSLTAHSVVTSELTKNAINPRNTFIDNDKAALVDPEIELGNSEIKDKNTVTFQESAPVDRGDAPAYPSITEHFDTRRALTESKKRRRDNRQKLPAENLIDDAKFFESLHKVEERISTLRQNQSKDNIQPLDQSSYKDNILYREKKNLVAHIQSVHENSQRNAASLPIDTNSIPSEEAVSASMTSEWDASSGDMNVDDAQLILHGEQGAFNEDELRARVKKMQEKLTRVNQTLKDIENKNDQ